MALTSEFGGVSIATCSMTFNHHGGSAYTKSFGGPEICSAPETTADASLPFDPRTLG